MYRILYRGLLTEFDEMGSHLLIDMDTPATPISDPDVTDAVKALEIQAEAEVQHFTLSAWRDYVTWLLVVQKDGLRPVAYTVCYKYRALSCTTSTERAWVCTRPIKKSRRIP